MTIAHRWNAGEQTISMRYGTTVGELIRRSSALETPPYLAHATSNISSTLSSDRQRAPDAQSESQHIVPEYRY